MSTSLLEIVDMGDGEIVLQRADDDSEPLVTIRFSEESQLYLMDNGLEVAKAMIQAGIQAAATLSEEAEQEVGGRVCAGAQHARRLRRGRASTSRWATSTTARSATAPSRTGSR